MLRRFDRSQMLCLTMAVILAVLAGCPEKEKPPPTTAADTKAEVSQPQEPAEAASAEVEAKLAQADAFDGTVDKIVSKCPGCALAMDGSPDHTLEVAGYTLHFCRAQCKETFAKDTTKSILAMEIPEE